MENQSNKQSKVLNSDVNMSLLMQAFFLQVV